MSDNKKAKVLHVDNLVIHAKNVEIIEERKEDDYPRRDPWGFLWGSRKPRVGGQQDEERKNEMGPDEDEKHY